MQKAETNGTPLKGVLLREKTKFWLPSSVLGIGGGNSKDVKQKGGWRPPSWRYKTDGPHLRPAKERRTARGKRGLTRKGSQARCARTVFQQVKRLSKGVAPQGEGQQPRCEKGTRKGGQRLSKSPQKKTAPSRGKQMMKRRSEFSQLLRGIGVFRGIEGTGF